MNNVSSLYFIGYYIMESRQDKWASFFTLNPSWNHVLVEIASFDTVTCNSHISYPICFQIWNNNTLRDSFMGRCEFASSADMTKKVIDLDLFGRKKDERTKKRAGKVFIEISQTRSLTSI